jgi:hypothetical protein
MSLKHAIYMDYMRAVEAKKTSEKRNEKKVKTESKCTPKGKAIQTRRHRFC